MAEYMTDLGEDGASKMRLLSLYSPESADSKEMNNYHPPNMGGFSLPQLTDNRLRVNAHFLTLFIEHVLRIPSVAHLKD